MQTEKSVRIITDCTGVKLYAIEGIFRKNFTHISVQNKLSPKIKTPLSQRDLIVAVKERLNCIVEESVDYQKNNCFFATIQRGFEFDGMTWHLIAGVSLRSPSGQIVRAFTSTVPLDEDISQLKTEDRERNIKDLLSEKFKEWNKSSSMYEFLTEEAEENWLQAPLRACMKNLLRNQKTSQ